MTLSINSKAVSSVECSVLNHIVHYKVVPFPEKSYKVV